MGHIRRYIVSRAGLWAAVALTYVVGVACSGGQPRAVPLSVRCGGGEAAACLRLGLRLEDGGDDLPDPAGATRAYGKACALLELAGCWRQGALLRLSPRETKATKARALFVRACTGGAAMGCLYLAEMERLGEGGPKDTTSATRRYARLCQGGLKQACNDLGVAQQTRSAADAAATFRKSCDGGSQLACANLGVLLVKKGEVVEAVPYLQLACQRQEASACVQLAVLYETGRVDTKADATRAAMLYQRACKGGHEDGCSGLAVLLFLGKGVAAKPKTAMRIWRTVCETGHGPSCLNLATAYRKGAKGIIPANAKAAEAWAGKACALGVLKACKSLR